MSNTDLAKAKRMGQSLVVRLLRSRMISITNFKTLSDTIMRMGYRCLKNETGPWLPPGGRQVIWMKDRIIVKLKTRGTKCGPRTGKPHASFSYMKANRAIEWKDELAKFDYRGKLVFKSKVTVAQAQDKIDKNPNHEFSWPTCIDTQRNEDDMDDWANSCHFGFYNDHFDDTGADKYFCG